MTALRQTFPELNTMQDRGLAEAVVSIWNEVLDRSAWQAVEDARFSIGADEISLIGHTRAVLNHALDIADSLKTVHGRIVPLNQDY